MKVEHCCPNGTVNPITVAGRGSATTDGEESKALMGKSKTPFNQWKTRKENCPWAKTYKKLQDRC